MNTFHGTVLGTSVANQVSNTVRKSGTSDGPHYVENYHTRENDRMDMWSLSFIGIFFGILYMFGPASEIKDSFLMGLWDFFYIGTYLLGLLAITDVSSNDKQPKSAIKAAYLMSATLTLVMIIPFILDMDTQIHFRECWGGFGVNGNMHYFYNEHTDYTNWIQIGIMVIWCLYRTIKPLFRLYQMKNEL